MSVTTRVYVEPDRLPSPAEWAREIRARGFALDFVDDFEPAESQGFLPCLHQGQPAGFEYDVTPGAQPDPAAVEAVGTKRTLEVAFSTHADMRELVSAMIASSVLAAIADGVVFSDEAGEVLTADDAIALARETESDLDNA